MFECVCVCVRKCLSVFAPGAGAGAAPAPFPLVMVGCGRGCPRPLCMVVTPGGGRRPGPRTIDADRDRPSRGHFSSSGPLTGPDSTLTLSCASIALRTSFWELEMAENDPKTVTTVTTVTVADDRRSPRGLQLIVELFDTFEALRALLSCCQGSKL